MQISKITPNFIKNFNYKSNLMSHSSKHYFLSHHLSQIYHTTTLITAPLLTPGSSMSGALHNAFWRGCSARGRRLGRSYRVTGAVHRESLRVAAAWAASAFHMVGAVHRTFWRSCGVRGRCLGRACLSCGKRSTQSLLEELRCAWPMLGPRLPFVW